MFLENYPYPSSFHTETRRAYLLPNLAFVKMGKQSICNEADCSPYASTEGLMDCPILIDSDIAANGLDSNSVLLDNNQQFCLFKPIGAEANIWRCGQTPR